MNRKFTFYGLVLLMSVLGAGASILSLERGEDIVFSIFSLIVTLATGVYSFNQVESTFPKEEKKWKVSEEEVKRIQKQEMPSLTEPQANIWRHGFLKGLEQYLKKNK